MGLEVRELGSQEARRGGDRESLREGALGSQALPSARSRFRSLEFGNYKTSSDPLSGHDPKGLRSFAVRVTVLPVAGSQAFDCFLRNPSERRNEFRKLLDVLEGFPPEAESGLRGKGLVVLNLP